MCSEQEPTKRGNVASENMINPHTPSQSTYPLPGANPYARLTPSSISWRRLALIASLKSMLLLALCWFAFPDVARANPTAVPERAQVIMVFGDSLSAAYGINPNEGWVSLMERSLQGQPGQAPRSVRVVNASISGETTAGGANRIRNDLAKHKPNIVVLALGANDGLRGLAVREMRANLVKMLDAIRDAGARAILVGIQIPPNYGLDYAASFRDTFGQLARERKLPLVPFLLEGLAEDLANFQPDRLHPTAAAQPRILRNVLPVVERTLGTSAPVNKSAAPKAS